MSDSTYFSSPTLEIRKKNWRIMDMPAAATLVVMLITGSLSMVDFRRVYQAVNVAGSPIVFSVSESIFVEHPDYVRGVVICFGVKNSPSPNDLIAMLREAEAKLRNTIDLKTIAQQPQILAWREAYRLFGAKPSEFRSSNEAMVRRVLNGNELPTINRLVDIGNMVSLMSLVPVGGHSLDRVTGNLELRPATGDENFVAMGSDTLEHPEPGEIIFVEGKTVLTRRWTWRQANHTLTLPETTSIEFNVDGLPPLSRDRIEQICQDVANLVAKFCGGRIRCGLLSAAGATIQLSP